MQQHNENSENRKKIINVLQIKTNVYDFTSPFYFKYIFLNVKKNQTKKEGVKLWQQQFVVEIIGQNKKCHITFPVS